MFDGCCWHSDLEWGESMSAIEASSAGVKDMADGSLRITVEFEPRFAKDAYALFGARGTQLAIAALQVGYAQVSEVREVIEKPKGGPLAKLAGIWCNDPQFWKWIDNVSKVDGCDSADVAAGYIYAKCDIDSRAELDNNQVAAEKFHRLIRGPYSKYSYAKGYE